MRSGSFSLIVFSALLILPAAAVGSAESPSAQPSGLVLNSLADYLDYAQDHNLQLQRATARLKGVLGRFPQAGRMPNPKVTYGDSLEEVQLLHTNLTPQRNTFGLTQTIPWFGKRGIEKNSMSLQARAEWKRYEAESLKIFHEVRVAFYEYAHLQRSGELITKAIEQLQLSPSHKAAAQDRLAKVFTERAEIVARLNSMLNRQTDADLPDPATEPFELKKINKGNFIAKLLVSNPELAAIDMEIAATQSSLKLADKKRYPDFAVGLDLVQTDDAPHTGPGGSDDDPVVAMVSLSLPAAANNSKQLLRQKRAKLRETIAKRAHLQNDLTARASKLLFKFEDSVRRLTKLREVLIPEAENQVKTSQTLVQKDDTDINTPPDARTKLLDFQLNYDRAIADNLQTLAALEMLVPPCDVWEGVYLSANSTKHSPDDDFSSIAR